MESSVPRLVCHGGLAWPCVLQASGGGGCRRGGRRRLWWVCACVPRRAEGLSPRQAARSCVGTLTALGICSLCAGKGACLSLSRGKPGLFVFSPVLSPDDPPWRCPSPDACSPSACSPARQGDPLCKCLSVCSVRSAPCCSRPAPLLLAPASGSPLPGSRAGCAPRARCRAQHPGRRRGHERLFPASHC